MHPCDLAAIISIACVISIAFTLLAPITPLELERRHIDPIYTGVIFGIFSLPWILIPLFLSASCYSKIGTRNAL